MSQFSAYIGIDYSGAGTPAAHIGGLQAYQATQNEEPVCVAPPAQPAKQWSRKGIAQWLVEQLSNEPTIVGIDHAFSFPASYLDRYRPRDWDEFLNDFLEHWPAHEVPVHSLRKNNARTGTMRDGFRFTDTWTSSAKCVFQFGVPGSVATSTHACIPWLHFLRHRAELAGKVHFWPFDGFDVPPGRSVVAEVYPSIFRNRYPRDGRNGDQQDAYATARWLKEMDERGALDRFFHPPLSEDERQLARREGWILGIG